MNVDINTANFTIIILAFFSLIIILIIFKKIVRIIFLFLVLGGFLYYVIVFSNMLRPQQEHAKYSINYIRQEFGKNLRTHRDSVEYFYIINPIYNDLITKYTNEQLLQYEKKPIEYYKIVNATIKQNKKEIIRNLAQAKEKQLWNNFLRDMKKNYNLNELSQ